VIVLSAKDREPSCAFHGPRFAQNAVLLGRFRTVSDCNREIKGQVSSFRLPRPFKMGCGWEREG